jgi:hypothetical protein
VSWWQKIQRGKMKEEAKKTKKRGDMVKAIFAYTPRVKLGKMVEMEELVHFISGRSPLTEGTVANALAELRDAVVFFAMAGRPVRVKGLGIFAPRIDLNGVLGINQKPDKWLKHQLNLEGEFTGEIVNRDMIGKTSDDLLARWNQEHPEDPIKVK